MPRLIIVGNIFEAHKRDIRHVPVGSGVMEYLPGEVPEKHWQFIHSGKSISIDQVRTFVFTREDEEIIARVVPGVSAAILAGGATALAEASTLAAMGYTAAAAVINAVIAVGIGYGLNALVNAFTKKPREVSNPDETPTYSWDGIQNTISNGTQIPIIYGHHKFGGHFLSTFTKAQADGSNALYMLLGLGAGPIEGINGVFADSDSLTGASVGDGLKINNSVGTQFSDLSVSYRMGAFDQSIAPGFDDVIYEVDVGQSISDTPYTYTTADDVQAVELLFQFPSGLYQWTTAGAFLPCEVIYKYRYREDDVSASWSSYTNVTFSTQTRSTYNAQTRIDFSRISKYQIEITRVSGDDGSYSSSAFSLRGVNEILYNDISYPGLALVGIKSAATEQLNGQLPTVTNEVYGKRVKVYDPTEDFGSDAEYTYTADGGAPYGWFSQNMAYATRVQAHTYAANTLAVLHGSTASNWSGTTITGPAIYKHIYKTIDDPYTVIVRVTFTGTPANGDNAGLWINSPYDANDWQALVLSYDGSDYTVKKIGSRSGSTASPVTYADTAMSSSVYLKVVISSQGNFAFSYSHDGATYTSAGGNTVTFDYDALDLNVGVCTFSTSGNSSFRANFTDLSFSGDTEYSLQCSSNPAWVIYDLLTDEHYGVGSYIDTSQIDLDTFKLFAAYCDEQVTNPKGGTHRRHRFDGVIEQAASAWEQIQRIAELYRAVVLRQGDKIHITWNDAKDAVQLFNVSNIVRSSFAETIHAPELAGNYWEVQYLNADNDWEQDYTTYVDPDIAAGEAYRRETAESFGITREQEALRRALYLCKANRHITKAVTFETGIDAIACEPGDRIEVQHDLPQWGYGGRVVSATSNSITFDQEVTIAAGTSYQVRVRHAATDTIETVSVTTTAGNHWTVNTAAWDTVPSADDVYVFGQLTILTKPFIVVNIERTGALNCKIEAIEYNEDVYDDSIESVENVVYTALPDPRKIPDDVTNLTLAERAQVMRDRSIQNVIDVTYTLPAGAPKADIFYREQGYTAWQYSGRARGTFYTITAGIVYGSTYEVAVAAVSPWGLRKSPSDCPYSAITVLGRTTRPTTPTNLRVSVVGENIHLRWTGVDDADLQGYEIRYGPSDWNTATPLGVTTGTEYMTPNFAGGQTLYFQVRSYNTSGIYSATSLSVQQTLPDRSNENILIEYDAPNETTAGWPGTLDNLVIDSGNLKINQPSTNPLSGSYTTEVIDCGAVVRPLVSVSYKVTQTDNTLTWATATFSWGGDQGTNTTWSGTPGETHVTASLTFRYGSDSGDTALGDYEPFTVGEYAGRYFQFKLDLEVDSETYNATVEEFVVKIDVPDRICSQQNVELAEGSNTTITFTTAVPGFQGFNVTPEFFVTPTANLSHTSELPKVGDWIQVVSVSATQAVVRYYEYNGTPALGKISFLARGY